ncbi:MAG: NAD(P)H-dependent oxidoreductase subunit E [Chloroflexota bacterium]|nr:NAD(P)H-dependent oxidoreductase subunit E [Chloroflexota bacterium]
MPVTDTWTDTEEDVRRIHAVMDEFEGEDPMESLIPALHHVQELYGYVPESVAELISERWHIPVTDIFAVVTFYADFRAEPQGRRTLWVCEGAACYFMGALDLARAAQERLKIAYNETTEDGEWTLRRADFCFGACQLAPLVSVGHTIHGPVTPEQLLSLLANPPATDVGSH